MKEFFKWTIVSLMSIGLSFGAFSLGKDMSRDAHIKQYKKDRAVRIQKRKDKINLKNWEIFRMIQYFDSTGNIPLTNPASARDQIDREEAGSLSIPKVKPIDAGREAMLELEQMDIE